MRKPFLLPAIVAFTFSLFIFLSISNTPVNAAAANCDCEGSCSVGYVCDFCSKKGSSGPATWKCSKGCCFRPKDCAGASACHDNGYEDKSRPGCASSPDECGGTTPKPTKKPPTPTPPGTTACIGEGEYEGLPGYCSWGDCEHPYVTGCLWSISGDTECCSISEPICCVIAPKSTRIPNPTIIPRPPLNPKGDCSIRHIDTAIGCIPVSDIMKFLGFSLRWSLGIGGGVSFLMLLFAGFVYMTSKGDSEKVQMAKEYLSAAAGGLLILIFSIFLLELIGVRILQLPGF